MGVFALLAVILASPSVAGSTDARRLLARGELEAARAAAEASLVGPAPGRATVDLAEVAFLAGRVEEALARIRAREEREPGRALPALAAGALARLRRDLSAADELTAAALEAMRARADPETTVALEQLAFVLQDGGHWREAYRLHEGNRHSRDPFVALAATYGLAYCSIPEKNYATAERLATAVVEEANAERLPTLAGDAEALLATLRWIELDGPSTMAHLEAALAAYESAGRRDRQASCLRRAAAAHLSLGEYPAALERLHRARRLALAAGDVREASFCLEHLGSAHHELGRDADALRCWRAALDEGGDSWPADWRIGALENIGGAEAAAGDPDGALGAFGRALDELSGTESRLAEPSLLLRLARCLREAGHEERALARLDESMAAARALALAPAEASALIEIGEMHLAAHRTAEADAAFARAHQLVRGSGIPELEIAVLAGRAGVSRQRSDPATALVQLEEAMKLAERVRHRARGATAIQQEAFGRHAILWDRAIGACHDLGADRRAFGVAQRAKARSFLDALAETESEQKLRRAPAYRARERELLAAIAALDARPAGGAAADSVELAIRVIEDELAILEAGARGPGATPPWDPDPEPVEVETLQRALGPDEILLEYFLGEQASWVWCVGRESFRMERLPARAVLERDVRTLLPLLRDYNLLGNDPTYYVPAAIAVTRDLLGPIAAEVAGARTVLVVPHGILHYLPFEALLAAAPAPGAPFRALPWLVLERDISYLPAATLSTRVGRGPPDRESRVTLVLLGDPSGAPEEVFLPPALDGSRTFAAELDGLAASWPGPVARRVGPDATPAALQALGPMGPLVLHVSAHGVLNERRPRLSGIVLSPSANDDGFLGVDEVLALDLPAEAVVLAACSSALGREVSGEGLVGLARAFLHAGARSVVAALWEVPSERTTPLMIDLHRLGATSGDRIHALADAKRAAIDSGFGASPRAGLADPAHPAFWAGFVHVGGGN